MRDDGVFIRTVSGLKRTEVLLRRLDADFADPLELNAALAARRRRPAAGGARRQGRDRQCARRRPGRGARHAGLPAGAGAAACSAPSSPCRMSRPGGSADADVREAMIEKLDSMVIASAFTDRIADEPARRSGMLGAKLDAAQREALVQSIARSRHRLRRAGGGDAVDHAGLARRPLAAAAVHPAAVPRQGRRRLAGHARRLRAHRRQRRRARGQPAARRRAPRTPGCCAHGPVGETTLLPTPERIAGPARHRAIAEPRRRQSVLGRPLCRTRRGDAAARARADQSQRRGRRCRGAGDRAASARCSPPGARSRTTSSQARAAPDRARGADAARDLEGSLPRARRRSARGRLGDPRPLFARRLARAQRSRHHDRRRRCRPDPPKAPSPSGSRRRCASSRRSPASRRRT